MKENEQNNEKRETVADILAKMVRESIIYVSIPTTDLKRYADRIEAAWKRERDRLMTEPRSWDECVERAMKVKENSDVLY